MLILPEIEQGTVAAIYDFSKSHNHPDNRQAVETQMKVHTCPSVPKTNRVLTFNSVPVVPPQVQAAVSDYPAVGGMVATMWTSSPPTLTSAPSFLS